MRWYAIINVEMQRPEIGMFVERSESILMKKTFANIALSAMVAGSMLVAGGARAMAADTIGTVDYDKLLSSYSRYQTFTDDMKSKDADLQKMRADFVKQINEVKTKQPNNPVAVDQLEKTLNDRFTAKVQEYQSAQDGQVSSLQSDLNGAIDTVAKSKGLTVILAKQMVLVGGTDVTTDVLSKLNSATPSAPKTPAKGPAKK